MVNMKRGVAPLDPATDVGRFRLATGDVDFVPLDPPEVGFGAYAVWGDAQIEAFIVLGGGSVARAIALAYSQMAAGWASSGATIKTDDLTYSSKDSVGNWLNLAKYWDEIADAEDSRAIDNYFDLVEVRSEGRCCTPELAARSYCCGGGFW